MGLIQSKKSHEQESLKPDTSILEERLRQLELKVDLNKDGIVTKAELEDYLSTDTHLKDIEILSLKNDKLALQDEMNKLKSKLEKLQNAYNILHQNYEEKLSTSGTSGTSSTSEKSHVRISESALEKYVDDLLSDPTINIYYLPDKIEKPLYINTLKILLGIMQKSLHHINIDIIGHELKLSIEPSKN